MTQVQQLHPHGTAEDEVTSQFYIPAVSSLQERRLRALKHGDSFALFNHYGDIVPFRGAPDGLYHCDTRYLSHLELRLNGEPRKRRRGSQDASTEPKRIEPYILAASIGVGRPAAKYERKAAGLPK